MAMLLCQFRVKSPTITITITTIPCPLQVCFGTRPSARAPGTGRVSTAGPQPRRPGYLVKCVLLLSPTQRPMTTSHRHVVPGGRHVYFHPGDSHMRKQKPTGRERSTGACWDSCVHLAAAPRTTGVCKHHVVRHVVSIVTSPVGYRRSARGAEYVVKGRHKKQQACWFVGCAGGRRKQPGNHQHGIQHCLLVLHHTRFPQVFHFPFHLSKMIIEIIIKKSIPTRHKTTSMLYAIFIMRSNFILDKIPNKMPNFKKHFLLRWHEFDLSGHKEFL